MLTSDPTDTSRAAARTNGAAGYLLKGTGADLMLRTIHHIAAGGSTWSHEPGPSCSTWF